MVCISICPKLSSIWFPLREVISRALTRFTVFDGFPHGLSFTLQIWHSKLKYETIYVPNHIEANQLPDVWYVKKKQFPICSHINSIFSVMFVYLFVCLCTKPRIKDNQLPCVMCEICKEKQVPLSICSHIYSIFSVMSVVRSSRHQLKPAKKQALVTALDITSSSVEDQGSGYPLRVSKVTLKWTGPVKILSKGQLVRDLVPTLHSAF